MENNYYKTKIWCECPICKKLIQLSLAVKKGDRVIEYEVIGIDKP